MKGSKMETRAILILFNFLLIMELLGHLMVVEVYGDDQNSFSTQFTKNNYDHIARKIQAFQASNDSPSTPLIPPLKWAPPKEEKEEWERSSGREYHVTKYGADPTGKTDSTEALERVFEEVTKIASNVNRNDHSQILIAGITNLGGVQIHLDGGNYLITRPLRFPTPYIGNILIHGGTLRASNVFPIDHYLIELSASSTIDEIPPKTTSTTPYNFEYITFRDLMFDCSFRGGGIAIINSLRIGIDSCYITHFTTNAILVQAGHETLIRSSFIGQHITAGNDPNERDFSGTGINLMGNDNVVSDVVIFSASTGIILSGEANLISGVHCYNKAVGLGGKGIYLKLPGFAQTRIVNSYWDYTGIVVEDPAQLIISNNLFLGDAFISLKAIKGIANGISIVDNTFSGSGKGVDIIQLDGKFMDVDQVFVDRNIVDGMNSKATVSKIAVKGTGSSLTADFNGVLLFPNLIKHVQYTTAYVSDSFPVYALRSVSDNRVVIQSNLAVPTTAYVMVDQSFQN